MLGARQRSPCPSAAPTSAAGGQRWARERGSSPQAWARWSLRWRFGLQGPHRIGLPGSILSCHTGDRMLKERDTGRTPIATPQRLELV